MQADYEALFRLAPVGLAVLDLQLRFVAINDRLAEINGFPVAAHIGHTVRELLPSVADQAEAVLRRVRDTGEAVHDLEIVGETPAVPGRLRTWREQFTPARDAQGRMVGLYVVAEEITDQRRAEQGLSRSREQLQLALEAAGLVAWDWHIAGDGAEGAPDGPQASTGDGPVDPAQFLRRVHPDDRARVDAEIARVLASGGAHDVEFRVLQPDGQLRWLVSRGRALPDGAGGLRIVGVNFDITARKQTEQALIEADTRRVEFLAMLAHELRNPLAPIANAVRLLEKAGDEPERRQAATQILKRQSAHLARLVDDLLEVSRITQGRIELRTENVLAATAIFQAVEAARPQVRERHQTLTVDVPPSLDLVADPARLTQIVANLLNNAVKYTPDHGRIELRAWAEGEDTLLIAVQDDGAGISPELLPRLFDLFSQDRRTLDRADGGLGIGLALVKRLAEMHGGSVDCMSDGPGRGATFTVRLPRHGRRGRLRGSAVTPAAAAVPQLPILVVDDNRDAAQTLAALLELDGHRVAQAHDGEQALAQAQALLPRVVLLDLGLPKLDGIAVAQRLRADDRLRGAVIIAMSGYAQASDREATAGAGFDAHLAKPIDLADVYRVIEAALSA